MRTDQREKLDELSEQLTDVLLVEANPANWPGADVLPEDLDAKTGSRRYYAKKQASTTVTILTKVVALRALTARQDDPTDPVDTDQLIQQARQEVGDVLARIRRKPRGEPNRQGARPVVESPPTIDPENLRHKWPRNGR